LAVPLQRHFAAARSRRADPRALNPRLLATDAKVALLAAITRGRAALLAPLMPRTTELFDLVFQQPDRHPAADLDGEHIQRIPQ
jgi:hypothetical protein